MTLSELESEHFEQQRRANYLFLIILIIQLTLFAGLFVWQSIQLDTAPRDVLAAVQGNHQQVEQDIDHLTDDVQTLRVTLNAVHDAMQRPRVFQPQHAAELRKVLELDAITERLDQIEKAIHDGEDVRITGGN